MILRSPRNASITRALVLLPAALCVGVVVLAVPREDTAAGLPVVADPTPSLAPAPSSPVALTPGVTVAPATVIAGASVTRVRPGPPVTIGAGPVAPLSARRAVSAAGTTGAAAVAGIGTTALSAYQRAAAVVGQADATCHLDWTLLAAIGAVESGHGTYGGSTLDETGVATPAIEGPVLDGRHDTRRIEDTDGGRLDHDARYDRALGPMQILPATWLQIAVDGDSDGRRDPQDIDDAALAAAVYLCSAGTDLATAGGARAAVLRCNHSETYADTVLALAAGYAQDAAVPVGVLGPVTSGDATSALDVRAAEPPTPARPHGTKHHALKQSTRHHTDHPTKSLAPVAVHQPGHHAAPQPVAATPTPTPPVPAPTAGPDPVVTPPPSGAPTPAHEDLCHEAIVTTYPTAGAQALAAAVAACTTALAELSEDRAQAALPDLLAKLPDSVSDLGPAVAIASGDASPSPQETIAP